MEPRFWHGCGRARSRARRFRARHGGRTIYDSRDIYLHARSFDRSPRIVRAVFRWLERRWAGRVDAVITVNDAYASILARTLGRQVAAVVRNCPPRYDPPSPRRPHPQRLGLPRRLGLLHHGTSRRRGIEEGMSATSSSPRGPLPSASGTSPRPGRGARRDPGAPGLLSSGARPSSWLDCPGDCS